jgi:integrating conjugative element protein (TIGR03761 family)
MNERKPIALLRQPGALRSQTSLEIQTRQAQRLVYGRRAEPGKPAIFGLLRFGTLLRPIWEAAAADDPWADWCLVQIEQELREAREALEGQMQQVQRQLKSLPAMDVAVAHSVEPVRVELAFSSPYAFMGAYLLADYDGLVRAVLTGRHVGLFDRDTAEKTLREGGRVVRRAFNTPQGYRYLGVCREDLRQGTQKAERATALLGALPQAVIDGTLRAAHAPDIRPPGNASGALFDEDGDDPAFDDAPDGEAAPREGKTA